MRLAVCLLPLALFAACGGDDASNVSSTSENAPGGPAGTGEPGAQPGGGTQTGPGGTTPGGGDPGTTPPTPRPYVDFGINHVLITGQSNSVALSGRPVLTTTQPYANLMFDTGVMPMSGCDGAGCRTYATPSRFVPLVEGDNFFSWQAETAASSLANEASLLASKTPVGAHKILVSLHGRSGNTYWCLRKGGCDYKPGYLSPFEQGMSEVRSAKALADAAGETYAVRAVATIHGESDHYSYTVGSQEFPMDGSDGTPKKLASYADALLEWQADYEAEVKAITGQTEPVPLFVSQIAGWNDATYSKVAQFQLEAHTRAPGKVILIGASYMLPADEADCKHFTAVGQQRLGEYFAKAYARVVFDGLPWEPLRPKSVTVTGSALDVDFLVPAPPLVFDTDTVKPAENQGFSYYDAAGAPVPITGVEITGPSRVRVTLASPPASGGHLWYAQNQAPNTCIGPNRGARGNLRDSDATPSQTGNPLFNWAVNFDVPVP